MDQKFVISYAKPLYDFNVILSIKRSHRDLTFFYCIDSYRRLVFYISPHILVDDYQHFARI